ncbi:hypothetical protein fugu_000624 [Takifugu bimaculatus]|uniref:Uncharacterized protein n=1 Tax=Takifugu bimaculatus TaxID=433685 RepID=A0A4Z2CHF4_9TELE|nr:hypothetical protein fugu_000624 [Takifugu bimaculatus]
MEKILCGVHGTTCMLKTGVKEGPSKGKSFYICVDKQSCDFSQPTSISPSHCLQHEDSVVELQALVYNKQQQSHSLFYRCIEGKNAGQRWCGNVPWSAPKKDKRNPLSHTQQLPSCLPSVRNPFKAPEKDKDSEWRKMQGAGSVAKDGEACPPAEGSKAHQKENFVSAVAVAEEEDDLKSEISGTYRSKDLPPGMKLKKKVPDKEKNSPKVNGGGKLQEKVNYAKAGVAALRTSCRASAVTTARYRAMLASVFPRVPMATEPDRMEPMDSEQDEEDVYEVERIIDMRVEEGEVLYRVRWKNYCSDDDTWEPEAHLEDCREVLLAFKNSMAEAKVKKEPEAKKTTLLPIKSDVFDADSESDSDKDHPSEAPPKKKKKIKEEDLSPRETKKKKKDKPRDDGRPLPAPDTDEDEDEEKDHPPSSPIKEKRPEPRKQLVDSDEDEDDSVASKKHKKVKTKEGGRQKKGEEGKKKRGKRERKIETSEDEAAAPLEEELSDGPSESHMDTSASTDTTASSAEKTQLDKYKQKKGKLEVKPQGIQDKKKKRSDSSLKESSLQKLKSLTSKNKDDAAPHSDSSDSSTLHKKSKSKGQESTSASSKAPSSTASSSSSSSSSAAASTTKGKEDELIKEEVLGQKDASGLHQPVREIPVEL